MFLIMDQHDKETDVKETFCKVCNTSNLSLGRGKMFILYGGDDVGIKTSEVMCSNKCADIQLGIWKEKGLSSWA